MDLPRPIFLSFHHKINKTIHTATNAVREISMKNTAVAEKKLAKGQDSTMA